MILAITGATGFVGRRLLDLALAEGHGARALTRRPQPPRAGVTWIEGALDRPEALAALVAGAEATIHVAGVLTADNRAGFAAGNIDGTRAMLAAAAAAGGGRFVQVSSLAAREPGLSDYGWSKAEADALVAAAALDWTIVRPPAVYGPGDTETLELFRMARWGMALLPPAGRLSVIHVDDLARLLLALAASEGPQTILEPSDGTPGGLSHAGFARAIGAAMGRTAHPIALSPRMLRAASRLERLVRGRQAKLTADRVRYFCHPDWTADPALAPPTQLWRPAIDLAPGLADTVRWYRAHGKL